MNKRRAERPSGPKTAGRRAKRSPRGSFPIVGIGASAGGLEALSALLKHLPVDTGMAFVLVQHLDPDHPSALTRLLGRATSLPVDEITNNLRVAPNRVYVIPPNTHLTIAAGVLNLRARPKTRVPHRSIDLFLEALAADQRERAIGVILSGTATDGTLGLEAIKAEGGITFAQDDSARYDAMPRSAVAAGCVDFVQSPEDIAKELARIAKHPAVAGAVPRSPTPATDDAAPPEVPDGDESLRTGTLRGHIRGEEGFKKILHLLRNHSGVDFSLYKSSTIQRRITRRMVLTKQDALDRYARFLRGNSQELDALYSDVLINVTSFFRNPDAFEVLGHKVWPALLHQRADEPLRVWTLGCSTGQEAYSIAMSFVEAADKAPRPPPLQLFATDLSDSLLEKARRGLYARSIAQDLSPDRLRRFFVEEEGGYRINKTLREMVVFARQDVISDPPFSRLDLISCRNVLIYLEAGLQRRVFPAFHYALKPGGFLYLGASESVGGFTDLFRPVDKKHKIYARKAAPTGVLYPPARGDRGDPSTRSRQVRTPFPRRPAEGRAADAFGAELIAQREADRVAISQFAPPAVLINAELQILQFRGATGAYLEPASGKATFDVLKMARQGLTMPLRTAINKAKKQNKTARTEHVRVEHAGTVRTVNLEVIPLKNLRERCFLVVFEEAEKRARAAATSRAKRRPIAPPPGGTDRPRLGAGSRRNAALEAELAEARDYAQSIQEQYEAANEELQAANEESQSANEELQSLNEELETSKEELESANEELLTVNEEMVTRNSELSRVNSDLLNVQTSTQQAIVLLGRDLTIRRFSAEAEKQFNLLAPDVGRPLGNVRHNLEMSDLEPFVTEVMDSGRARDREVRDKDGRWFSLRVRPYLTLDNKVDGAVLVLVDINDLKRSELAIAGAREYAENIVETVREPLIVLDSELRVESANHSFYRTFGVTPAETIGRFLYDLGNGQWNIPELRALLEEVLPQSHTVDDFAVEREFERVGPRIMLLNARRMHGAGGPTARIVLAIEDVTERMETERKLSDSEERYRALFELGPVAVYSCDAAGVIQTFNRRAAELWGRAPAPGDTDERFCGSYKLFRPDGRFMPHAECPMAEVVAGRIPEARDQEVLIERPDGSRLTVIVNIVPLKNQHGDVAGAINCFYDITERKEAEEAIREVDRHKTEFLAILAHELRTPLAAIRTSLDIMRRTRMERTSRSQTAATASRGPEESAAFDLNHSEFSPEVVLDRQVGQLVRLVDDLLDASRISRGKLALRKEHVGLSAVIHHAAEAARPLFDRMGQTLALTVPPEEIYLNADPVRLSQMVGNLLSNASKFTDRGGRVWLSVEPGEEPAADTQGTSGQPSSPVVIRVRDTGIGIAEDQLPRVFDMFSQVDTSLERSRTGLGIGLTLVKTLAEMHGGTVEAGSPGIGRGSEFAIRLPTTVKAAALAPQSATSPPAPTAALNVLIVEDNADAAESLATLLQMRGHKTRTADDGLAAVEMAARHDPDVILLDIGLPGLNGYAAARRIREYQRDRRPVIVALTGWGQEEDRRRSADAGFDAHLVKPVDDAALGKLLAEVGAGKRTEGN